MDSAIEESKSERTDLVAGFQVAFGTRAAAAAASPRPTK